MPRDLALVDCLLFDGTDGSTADDRGVLIGTDGPIRAVGASDDVLAEAREAHIVDLAARAALRSGVTTVRLVGESRYADFALRRAIDAGAVDGPRTFTEGHALCCTGGHGWDADGLEADGADGFRRATREQLRAGADLIKVCISGGIAGEHESIDTPQLSDDEMAAVMETAHDWGRKVTSHAGPAPVIARALALGLDCVEHGYELTDELTRDMALRGVWYVSTIVVSRCEEFSVARPRGSSPRARAGSSSARRTACKTNTASNCSGGTSCPR